MSQQQQQQYQQQQQLSLAKTSQPLYPDPQSQRSLVNLNKYNFNYGSPSQSQNEEPTDPSKLNFASKANDFSLGASQNPNQFPQQLQSNTNPQYPLIGESFSQYQKQPTYQGYETPQSSRVAPLQQMTLNQNLYNIPSNSLINPTHQQQFGQPQGIPNNQPPQVDPLSMLNMPNTAGLTQQQQQHLFQQQLQFFSQMLASQSQPQQRPLPPQQQPDLQQYSTRNTLGINPASIPPQLIQSFLSQGLTPQQQKPPQMNNWNEFMSQPPLPSQLNTPLESSRFLMDTNTQSATSLNTASSINSNSGLPGGNGTGSNQMLSGYVQSQHQSFVQNYSQHLENLNQYKKLVNYLEQIDNSKPIKPIQGNQQLYQQQQQQLNKSPLQYQQQPLPLSTFVSSPSLLQQQQMPRGFEQSQFSIESMKDDKSVKGQVNDTASILWPSMTGGGSNSGRADGTSTPDKSAYSTFNKKASLTHQKTGPPQEHNFASQESYIEGKLNDIRYDISNSQHQKQSLHYNPMNSKQQDSGEHDTSMQQLTIEDCSKVSGGEVTKESISDVLNANAIQIPLQIAAHSDGGLGNKSAFIEDAVEGGSLHNQSHLSNDSRLFLNQRSAGKGQALMQSHQYEFKNQNLYEEQQLHMQHLHQQNVMMTLGAGEHQDHNLSNQELSNTSQHFIMVNGGEEEGGVTVSQEMAREFIEEKPIVQKQMTFEELLESKLQEEHQQTSSLEANEFKALQKREFLRKSSNVRGQGQLQERPKSTNKYKYYADNFQQQQQQVSASGNIKLQTLNTSDPKQQHSPKSSNINKKQSQSVENNLTNSVNKRYHQNTQKSNQKQPKQQNTSNKQAPTSQQQVTRPQSQQQCNSSTSGNTTDKNQAASSSVNTSQTPSNYKSTSVSQQRSRQSLTQTNVNTINSIQSKAYNPVDIDEEHIISERSSVLEFEMLEQECIKKMNQSKQAQKDKELKESRDKDKEKELSKSDNKTTKASAASKQQELKQQQKLKEEKLQQQQNNALFEKQQAEAQRVMDLKIKELDIEIQKFKRENKKVSQMQKECESQLKRINNEIQEFEERKEKDVEELAKWKDEQMEDIEQEMRKLQKEKQDLAKERETIDTTQNQSKAKSKHQEDAHITLIQSQQEELQRLRRYITSLETESKDLKGKLDELTDKQVHCVGVQTTAVQQVQQKDQSINTLAIQFTQHAPPQIQQVSQQVSQAKEEKKQAPVVVQQKEVNLKKTNEILMSSGVEQILEEEGEDGSKQSSNKPAEEEEYDEYHADSDTNQHEANKLSTSNQDFSDTEQDKHSTSFQEESKHLEGKAFSLVKTKSQSISKQDQEELDSMQPQEEEDEEDEYDLKFLAEYHGPLSKKVKLTEEVIGHDGKIQRIYENGKKEVVFTNGVKREVWPDGYSLVQFNNNDIKQTFPDGKIVYYFSDAKTTQTTFPNGLQVFKFSNSQIEKHFVDGTKEISFPDGTIKCLFPDGEEESIFPDGTIQKIEKNGVKIVEFPNGQRDVLYPDGTKVREYEDGTVKKIFTDGKMETIPPKSPHSTARAQKSHNASTNQPLSASMQTPNNHGKRHQQQYTPNANTHGQASGGSNYSKMLGGSGMIKKKY